MPQAASADEYEDNGLKMVFYNCETGEESYRVFHPSSTPSMETDDISANSFGNDDSGISTNAIIGSDDRVQVTNTTFAPYRYICYMYTVYKDGTESNPYSGFMIGSKAAVTAAHCIYDTDKIIDHIVVVPAKNGSTEPYGRTESTFFGIHEDYANNGDRADDWAIVELKHEIGRISQWPELKYKFGSYDGTSVVNTGYPGEYHCSVQNSADTLMISGRGTIRYSEENDQFGYGRGILRGDWDATGGNSGGPVFAYYPETGYTVIGILTGGSYDDGYSYNSDSCYTEVTRISSYMYDFFMSYR